LQTYRERVQAVTRADVQRAARAYVTPDTAALVVVGDAAAITDQVSEYAPEIEFYDSMGQRKRAAGTSEGGHDGEADG
jgi:Zn-dependent M16 (insulinase) family peptidase